MAARLQEEARRDEAADDLEGAHAERPVAAWERTDAPATLGTGSPARSNVRWDGPQVPAGTAGAGCASSAGTIASRAR